MHYGVLLFLLTIWANMLASQPLSAAQEAQATLSTLSTRKRVEQLIIDPVDGQLGAYLPFALDTLRPPAYLPKATFQQALHAFATDSAFMYRWAAAQLRFYPRLSFMIADTSMYYPRLFQQGLTQAGLGLLFPPPATSSPPDSTFGGFPLTRSSAYKKTYKYLKKRHKRASLDSACLRVLTYKHARIAADSTRQPAPARRTFPLLRHQFFQQSLALLKHTPRAFDEGPTLPLSPEHTLAWVHFASDTLTDFANRLADYRSFDALRYTEVSATELRAYDQVICTFTSPPTIAQRRYLQAGFLGSKTAFVALAFHVGSVIAYDSLPWGAQVLAHGLDAGWQDLAAQALCGGVGILPHHLYGEPTLALLPQQDVLSFVPAEYFNIDAQQLADSVDAIVLDAIAGQAFPGCQIIASKQNKVFLYKTYGHHTYDSLRAVQKADLYDLASVTKVMTATTALMYAYDKGHFDPAADAKAYFPKWSKVANIPMCYLLAHHAGLKPWIPYYRGLFKKNGHLKRAYLSPRPTRQYSTPLSKGLHLRNTFQKVIHKKIYESPLTSFGYQYSDLMFYLIPNLVERWFNARYEDFFPQTFYQKMGANTLCFNPLRYFAVTGIVPTEQDDFFRKMLLHGVVHDEGAALMGGVSGHAGLFGNAIDVAKVWSMYLNSGTYAGRAYLSAEAIARFTACVFCEEGNRRGLGFDKPLVAYDPERSMVAPHASAQSFGHSGFTGTLVWADPEEELLFVFLSNRVYPSRHQRAIYDKNVRPRLHTLLYRALRNDWGGLSEGYEGM